MESKIIYVENQYLGRDKGWLSVRLLMALFCFTAYYINMERESDSQLFLVVGCSILVVSLLMMYMLHYRITVEKRSILLSGLWTARLIKIDLNSIVKVQKAPYSKFFVNNPVYNLHQRGKVRFYAGGKDAIWLTDRDGLVYIIGTQRQVELEQAILKAKEA
ncbi:hypothetical protein SAMN05216436_107148 [bacterium A37T11]|nr:hypothetical protein SAMN05216436_107148 [bacterium A37T11]